MNKKDRHEINNKLQIILNYAEGLEPSKAHAVKAAVWDIRGLIKESAKDRMLREIDEFFNPQGSVTRGVNINPRPNTQPPTSRNH